MATVRLFTHGNGRIQIGAGTPRPYEIGIDVRFELGTRAFFKAVPDSGWEFEKFCNGETPPYCITQSEFNVVIDIEYGEVHAYFIRSAQTIIDQERKEREAADQSLGGRISGLEGVLNSHISSMIDSIESITSDMIDVTGFLDDIENWFITRFENMKETVIGWIEAAFIDILGRVLEHEVKK